MALIGVWLGATIKTISVEKEGAWLEEEREREREVCYWERKKRGSGKMKSCRRAEQEETLTSCELRQ
jgi:hypothetical protein